MPKRKNGVNLKNKGIREGWLIGICSECGQGPEWNKKPLTLQLDHIDGNPCNDAKENLRILCPNCHTQTPTYGGRKNGHGTVRVACIGCAFVIQKPKSKEENRIRQGQAGPYCKKCATKANGSVGLKSRYGTDDLSVKMVPVKCTLCGKINIRKKALVTWAEKHRSGEFFCNRACQNKFYWDNDRFGKKRTITRE